MFWGLGIVLTSLVSSEIELSVLIYQQDDCADNNPEISTTPGDWTECESLLEELITDCKNAGYDSCHLFQFDVCLSVPSQTYRSVMYKCTTPTCDDGIMNGNEEDVDCGGDCSLACPTDDCTDYSTTYDCGDDHVLIDNPETMFCETAPCTYWDRGVCCEEKARCSSFSFDCLDDSYALRWEARYMHCAGTECEISDWETCCAKRETCENFEPSYCDIYDDGTRFLFENPDQHYCESNRCVSYLDVDNCCDEGPPCSSMSCNYTEGLTLITNHAKTLCTNVTCDVDTCCTERASCADFKCWESDIYVDKYPKDSSLCHGVTCSSKWNSPDWNTCCLERETCKNDNRTYVCPEKNALVDDPTGVRCTNFTCSSPQDDIICCLPARCSNDDVVVCNSSTHYVNETAYCGGLTCTLHDEAECCIGSPCSEYSGCDGEIQTTNPDRNCEFIACTSYDHDTCCEERATCAEFDYCPSCQTPVDRGLCAGASCVSTDSVTCSCVDRGLVMNGIVGRYVEWSFYHITSECQSSFTFTDIDSTKILVADFFDIPCHWVVQVKEVTLEPGVKAYYYTIFISTTTITSATNNTRDPWYTLTYSSSWMSEEWAEALDDFTNGEWCGHVSVSSAHEVDYTPPADSSSLSVGAIIGIVVGALVVIAVIGVLIFKSRPKRL